MSGSGSRGRPANPPSTPKVVIDPMGHAGELVTGFESVDDIVAKVTGQG